MELGPGDRRNQRLRKKQEQNIVLLVIHSGGNLKPVHESSFSEPGIVPFPAIQRIIESADTPYFRLFGSESSFRYSSLI